MRRAGSNIFMIFDVFGSYLRMWSRHCRACRMVESRWFAGVLISFDECACHKGRRGDRATDPLAAWGSPSLAGSGMESVMAITCVVCVGVD
jgi:hypothetical protein